MRFRGWDRIPINIDDEEGCHVPETGDERPRKVQALAPVIISASRATDIPAFYPEWFMARLRKGYIRWTNPFSRQSQYVSFAKTRVIVFWSKNPRNLIQYLPELDARGLNYYVQFTLNNYEPERLEPGLPALEARIKTFNDLAGLIGPERVVWRFDPLILSETLTVDTLISRIKDVGNRIHGSTRRLVFSFVDIMAYKKVRENLGRTGFSGLREFSHEEKILFAEKLHGLNRTWGLDLFTCGEEIDLSGFGIRNGPCIDYELMSHLFYDDKDLMQFLHPGNQTILKGFEPGSTHLRRKDTGQRRECGCDVSKDIGQYNTCMHLCRYCYANHSEERAEGNYQRYLRHRQTNRFSATIIPDCD